jgi:hypothetical protein
MQLDLDDDETRALLNLLTAPTRFTPRRWKAKEQLADG